MQDANVEENIEDEETISQRTHILEMNQMLAKQVMERSRMLAGKDVF